MNKFLTAVIVTANLLALQTFSIARPVQAQTIQTLIPLEEIGLTEKTDGTHEILGVGGPGRNASGAMANVIEADEMNLDMLPSEPATSLSERIYQAEPTDACRQNSDFIFVVVCFSF